MAGLTASYRVFRAWAWLGIAVYALAGWAAGGQPAGGAIDQKAVAAQIKAMVGSQVKITWVRSTDGRCDYLGTVFKGKDDKVWVVMVFDTEEGQERVFAPAATPDAYCVPLITPNGQRVIWTRARKEIYIADWNGQHPRLLLNAIRALGVAEDPPGTEWVYVGEEDNGEGIPKAVYRYQIDKPTVKQLVWNKTTVGCKFELSRDGKWLVAGFGGNSCGLAELPNGNLQIFGQGCNEGQVFDGSFRVWHMLGGHYGIQMFDKGGTNGRFIKFDDAPGRNGVAAEWWYPSGFHWDGRFFSMSGPWQGPRHDKGNVILGQFNEDFRSVKQWIRVTNVPQSETYIYAWQAPPVLAPKIIKQPQDQAVQEGETVTFAVQAEGSPTPSFQWQQNGKDIPGANTPSYSMKAGRTVKDAVFTCALKNASGTAKSTPAKLSVKLKGPTPEVLAAWDAKLQTRLRDALKSGQKLALSPQARDKRPVLSVEANGDLSIELGPGVQGSLQWAKLTSEEKSALALAVCRDNEPSEQCLAGFYLLAAGRDAAAETCLNRGGKDAETVRALFK